MAGMRITRGKIVIEFGGVFTDVGDRTSSPPFALPIAGLLWWEALDMREDREDGSRCRRVSQGTDPVDDRAGRNRPAVAARGLGAYGGDRGMPQRSACRRRAWTVPTRSADCAWP